MCGSLTRLAGKCANPTLFEESSIMATVKRYQSGSVTRDSGGNWSNNSGPAYPGQSSAPFGGSVAKDGYTSSPGTKAGGSVNPGGSKTRSSGKGYI